MAEAIHRVRSYATEQDMNRYLADILTYVETLKDELNQEAIALEIDHKLMLI